MCFAPTPRALSAQINFQMGAGAEVFLTFDFEICLAPQPGAIF
jgi:hypothetical protein